MGTEGFKISQNRTEPSVEIHNGHTKVHEVCWTQYHVEMCVIEM